MKKLLSPGAMIGKLDAVVRRFPLAVLSIVAGTTLALLAINGFEDVINYRWAVFLGFSLTSSVAVTLAFEDRRSWIFNLLAGLAVAALWGVRCLFLPADLDDISAAQGVEIGVIEAASLFAVFFVAYLRRGADAQWWNFAVRTVVRLILGGIFAGVLYGGLSLAIFAVEELFNVDLISSEILADLSVACFMLFAPLYVLAGILSGARKHDPELHPKPLLKVLGLYIFGPILAVYTVILYVYLLKIVVTWELPNGLVSWLVTVLGVGGLVVTLMLWPQRMRGGNRVVDFLSRWTGAIIAPLLVLMTIGIARRISDYGWTPNRCYILLLNLWLYGIYIWLFVVRGRRVKWILISAVIVTLLSSVGPWSLARVTPRENADEVDTVEAESAEWFSADSTIMINKSYELGGGYGRFVKIDWNGYDGHEGNGIEFAREGGELVIRITEDNGISGAGAGDDRSFREFRISLVQAENGMTIRGEGFMFFVEECWGTHYESREDEYSRLQGCLFY